MNNYHSYIASLIQNGDFIIAEKELLKLLRHESKNLDLTYLLAILYVKSNKPKNAIVHFKKIYESDSKNLSYAFNYSLCLQNIGDFNKSLSISNILINQSKDINFYFLHFSNLVHLSLHDEALDFIDHVIKTYPNDKNAVNHKLKLLLNTNNSNELVIFTESLIFSQNFSFEEKFEFSKILSNSGKFREAIYIQEKMLAAHENNLNLILALAYNYGHISNFTRAVSYLDAAISYGFENCDIYLHKGIALAKLRHFDDAFFAYQKALYFDNTNTKVLLNLALLYQLIYNYQKSYDLLNSFSPSNELLSIYYTALGSCLNGLGKTSSAIEYFMLSIQHDSKNIDAYVNLGISYYDMESFDKAIEAYNIALSLNPEYPEAHNNLGYTLLRTHQFELGWSHYAYRFNTNEYSNNIISTNLPLWSPSLNNQKVLVLAEQGIGDQILFSSILSSLNCSNNSFFILISHKLLNLFKRSFPNFTFINEISNVNDFDSYIPIGNLGFYYRKSIYDFKGEAFLHPNYDLSLYFKNALPRNKKLNVGISWSSNNIKFGDFKSCSLKHFFLYLNNENLNLINLQPHNHKLSIFENNELITDASFIDFSEFDFYNDIDSLAALISSCDLVISTSNSTAHLAGALGKPTFLLLPKSKGRLWYWIPFNNHSLWYKSVTLIPQSVDGDWYSCFEKINSILLSSY